MAKTQEEISTITNSYFANDVKIGNSVRVAGIIKSIDDKETSSATAKRFKGEIALQDGDATYVARYAFFPEAIKNALIAAAAKLGKWDSFEFVFAAKKSAVNEKSYKWDVTFEVAPRMELLRSLALLEE